VTGPDEAAGPEPGAVADGPPRDERGAGATGDADPDAGRRDRQAPAWFEAVALAGGLGAVALAAPGLALAVAGSYQPLLALTLGAAAFALFLPAVATVARRTHAVSAATSVAALLAVAVAVVSFLADAWAPAQHVFVDRDPAAYVTAGRWLARDGTLEPTVAVGPFADAEGLRFDSLAVPDSGDGTVELQFNHTLPVLLADAHAVGGARALFRVPALLGALALLPLHAVAQRLLRRPLLALGATTIVAVALPQVAMARDAFSEPLTQLWLWSGVLALLAAHERRSWWLGLAAGALLGGTAMARIDGLAYLLLVPVLAAIALRVASRPDRPELVRVLVAFTAAATVAAGLGLLDLALRGDAYEDAHASLVGQLRLAMLVTLAAGAALWWQWGRLPWPWLRAHAGILGRVAAAVTLVALLALWFVRPHVQEARSPVESGLVGLLQEAEGQPVEPDRSYDEDSMRWLAWYLGPLTLAVGIAGAAHAARRLVTRGGPALATTVLVAAPAAALYLWRPNAAPDHIWVMRRFVPAALPLVAVLAAYALARLRRGTSATVVATVVLVAGVAFAGAATWPVRAHHEQRGFLDVIEGACDLAGPDSAVLVMDDGSPASEVIAGGIPMALRAWCGVPVAIAPPGYPDDDVVALAAAWEDEGRSLVLAGAGPAVFGSLAEGREILNTPFVVNDRALERTLTRRPDTYRSEQLGFALVRV
jgi:hypothetical protein